MHTPSIPILDFRRFRADVSGFAADLGAAWEEFGFVGVRSHGIPDEVIAGAYAAVKELFALPRAVKERYVVPGAGGQRGYTPFGVEHAKDSDTADLKEFWHVGRELPASSPWAGALDPNVWPREVAGFRERTMALYRALDGLGNALLRAAAIHLGLPGGWFEDKVDHGNSVLRPIHYPPIVGEPAGVRSGRHEDINLITLLVGSGEPGLEILSRSGEWIPVDTIPGTIVVNVGDILQRLTNKVLRSTTHRVVNPPRPYSEMPRYSLPFFLHPNAEMMVATLPQCVSPERPDLFPTPISADAFLTQRLVEIGLLTPKG
jgi:isopenicillin N synthase-like dioxygenase